MRSLLILLRAIYLSLCGTMDLHHYLPRNAAPCCAADPADLPTLFLESRCEGREPEMVGAMEITLLSCGMKRVGWA